MEKEDTDEDVKLPELYEGLIVEGVQTKVTEHYTQPPKHYTEDSLLSAIWEQTADKKSTQLIFCDLSTPKGDGTFNVYEDIRNKLIEKGVPKEEIAFIHEANTELRKAELFGKVRSGQVRFLLGSTQKMGAGTNVQDRLIALHHLDVPWRPSEVERAKEMLDKLSEYKPLAKV